MKKPKHLFEIIIISLIIICIFVISFTYNRDSISSVESRIEYVLSRVQGFFYGIGGSVKSSIDSIVNFSTIKQENDDLKKENYELKKEVEELKADGEQNERLRNQLELIDDNELYTYKGCNIISIGGVGGYPDEIIIDKGSKDGIRNEMVVVYLNNLVGKVVAAHNEVSVVQLLTNENIRVSALISGNDDADEYATAYASGYRNNSNKIMCRYTISSSADVKIGDKIVTSGVGNIYPKGIDIGKITSVEEDKVKLQKICNVEPFTNINSLREVFVVIPSDKLNVEY